MSIKVDIQRAARVAAADMPLAREFRVWVRAALAPRRHDAELTLRVVDEEESAYLNKTYRGKPGPTNVLSFAAEISPEVPVALLGDLVICAPVVLREADEQHKPAQAHWAHMTVHGCLHLLGYDHQTARAARAMEMLEIEVLGQLGFSNPYAGVRTLQKRNVKKK